MNAEKFSFRLNEEMLRQSNIKDRKLYTAVKSEDVYHISFDGECVEYSMDEVNRYTTDGSWLVSNEEDE